ncbi:MAG: pyrroline-5-carboxylate reductase [Thiomargarita sp.]|nr:pyrroline-5-carboxylate reductase [Thiomargarita sp.]
MKNKIITFIGGGNMASSLIGGLLETGIERELLRVADPNPSPLARQWQVECYTDNIAAIKDSNIIILAVKPQVLATVVKSIATAISEPLPLFISIAAGIRIENIACWLGNLPVPIIRVMPNVPALIRNGASALYANKYANQEQQQLAENILQAVGLTVWLDDEIQMDAVTALSGSGPAYFFLIMEMLEKTAINLGLPANTARQLTLQTAFGATKMALESQDDMASLRAKVTSKGGTTEKAIEVLQNAGLQNIFDQALSAAQQQANELAKQFGK